MSLVQERVGVGVDIRTQSTTAVANMTIQSILHILRERGLPPDHVVRKRETIESGLFAWLAEESLRTLSVEIYDARSRIALERWDLSFEYSTTPDPTFRAVNRERIAAHCSKLNKLPAGTAVRVVVQTAPGASVVDGWSPTEYYELQSSGHVDISSHGFGNIGAKLVYRGGSSRSGD